MPVYGLQGDNKCDMDRMQGRRRRTFPRCPCSPHGRYLIAASDENANPTRTEMSNRRHKLKLSVYSGGRSGLFSEVRHADRLRDDRLVGQVPEPLEVLVAATRVCIAAGRDVPCVADV